LPARALGFHGAARCYRGDLDGLAEVEQGLELLVAEGKGRAAAFLHHGRAVIQWFLEGPAAALPQVEQAEAFAVARGLTEPARVIAATRTGVLLELGRLDEALAQAETLAPALQEGGDLFSLLELRASQARALAEQGKDASAEGEEALRLARDREDPHQLAVATAAAAPARLAADDRTAAVALLEELAAATIHDDPEYYALRLPALARAAAQAGEPELVARLAVDVPETLPSQQHALASARALQAEASGDFAGGARLHAHAANRWEQFGSVLEHAHALLGHGRCLTQLADPDADQPLRRARALFTSMNARARVAECDSFIAQTAKLSS
jgi:hypothetical protein